MERINKIFAMIICCILFMAPVSAKCYAEEYVSDKRGLDVIFVMDYSGSMQSNDPEHIAKAMVKAFIDTVHSADIRIGFVSYNDRILSSTSPVSVETVEQRENLKRLIDVAEYSGNTDIGLGLRYAEKLIGQETGRKKAIVLISDGESDLKGSATGRTLWNSEMDVDFVLNRCREQSIPIHTIAFGTYDGNVQRLMELSEQTGVQSYTVKEPETLIEILYGIFTTNMDYSIQEITSGIYAQGMQNIRIKLEEDYLDELDVLMISPQQIGTTEVLYGEQRIEPVNLNSYAVAKITDVDSRMKELTIQMETQKNQELKIYLISYRNLTPILKLEPVIDKNAVFKYEVYFRDKSSTIISDDKFYGNFACELNLFSDDGQAAKSQDLAVSVQNGVIGGEMTLGRSGFYSIDGRLDDSMGSCLFGPIAIEVQNQKPIGELPKQEAFTIFAGEKKHALDEYFKDPNGDTLTYTLPETGASYAQAEISEGVLTVKAQKSGAEVIRLMISDGEEEISYDWKVTVMPLWRTYWWVILLVCAAISTALWKIFHKPKPELVQIVERKIQNRFGGKLDAYVTAQPENTAEIPPLTFSMHKLKTNKVSLGELLNAYPDVADALELACIFLIADEERRIILYHTSNASIMIGNSIVCRQLQYSIGFGDVIYITSSNGAYELEIHYISMIQ